MFPLQLWLTGRQLAAKSPQTRLDAVQKLRQRGSVPVLLVLAKVLQDPDPAVQAEAKTAFREGLQEAAEAVQEEVLQALKKPGSAATEPLVVALEAGAAGVRWKAAQALRLACWQPRNQAEELAFRIAVGDLERAAAAGPAAITPLSQVLRKGSYQQRVAAADLLGNFSEPEVLPPLIEALKDSEAVVRTAAAAALGRVNRQEAVEGLLATLKDHEPNVRAAVVGALGQLKDPQTVEPLITVLNDPNWQVRAAALESLGRLHDPRALGPVADRLSDPDAEVRQHAAASLGELGEDSAIEQLIRLALDENAGVRQAASRSLLKLDPAWEQTPQAQRLVPELQAALKRPDAGVQYAATTMLRRITGLSPAEMAEAASRAAAEKRLATTVSVLARLLPHPHALVRLAATDALGRLATPAAVEVLRQNVDAEDPWVRSTTHALLEALTKGKGRA